ncbi:MAG: sulfite exporter TauE/SafE family protein [Nitrososphaera sp.]|nr:sulfite exporter TauE/SafE family protein [Nitrososphaera sp.]
MPVLVYVLGVEAHKAVGMSLAVVGVTSLIGAILHSRRGSVELKTGAFFGASGILGAYFGSHLTHLFSPAALLLSFAALMILISTLMLTRRQSREDPRSSGHRSNVKAALAGLVVGVLTGFLV